MATLVLSTVGTALGGPIGGAIGALVGQSFDQQLLAPVTRGPRLGDLSVQTSSYGTQIPRIYGAMRVAGSVIWATDLIESEQTTGAKGQPDVTYGYSVSIAVALSSRVAGAVGRIWADGKLLRGADGSFKVSTTYRFYDGGEDQPIDPLIGSIEGISDTPAYRGLALAVFENLQLADYGNRIPFLTFEVIADAEPPKLGDILDDASDGAVAATSGQIIVGYAAYGGSIKAALEPLVEAFAVQLFDDGVQLRGPRGLEPVSIDADELGNGLDGQKMPRFQREQLAARTLPAVLRLSYYDPARDYQTGEARSAAGESPGLEAKRELPAVLSANDAKSLAHEILARAWATRDTLSLRLPPSRLALEPGSLLSLNLRPALWVIQKCIVDGLAVETELRPANGSMAALTADAGRIVPNIDVAASAMSVALLDLPNTSMSFSAEPTLVIAASRESAGWKRSVVEIRIGDQVKVVETAARKSFLGNALTGLARADSDLLDLENFVEVQLIDADQWLTSCDDAGLVAGKNLAVLGSELVQFGSAVPVGPGRFRLGRFVRARAGTEWAVSKHVAGELFCLLTPESVQSIILQDWAIGSVVTAVPSGQSASAEFVAESLRPPSPVRLNAVLQSSGDLLIEWVRRSRRGWAWVDEMDAPFGEAAERYRINLSGPAGSAEILTSTPAYAVPPALLSGLGPGELAIEVRQLGDRAVSHPAGIAITLP